MMKSLPFFILMCILAVGFVVGLFHYKSKPTMRPIIILLGFTLLCEIASYYIGKYYRNNMPLAHFFNPVQMIIWAFFYSTNYVDAGMRKLVVRAALLMLILAVLNTLFLQPLKTFPDNFIKLETMLFIMCGAYLFIQQLDLPSRINVFREPVFIVAVAVLWFNLLSFLFFLLYAYLMKHNLPSKNIRSIHFLSNYVYYILLLVAILLPQQPMTHERKV